MMAAPLPRAEQTAPSIAEAEIALGLEPLAPSAPQPG